MDQQWSGVPSPQHDASTPYKQDELIVRFADPEAGTQLPEGPVLMGPLTRRAIRSSISDFIVAGAVVDTEYDTIAPGLAVVKLPAGTNVLDAGIKFLQSANVIYAEPNYKYKPCVVPNDPFFPDLWGLENTGQTGGTEDADIDAPEAWDITTGSSDIVVAVIDSGIDYMHPDLVANMWVNAAEYAGTPGVDDDGNGYIDDIYGYDFAGASAARPGDGNGDPQDAWFHGTHVAGIIGAVGNNGQGVAGVCWNVRMMALKIYADDFNVVPESFAADAIEAVQYAIDNGADIINFSSGGEYDSQALKETIEKAGDAGLLFVAGAGNDYGSDNDETPVYPASYDLDNIISVMSTDANDMMSDFSNFGADSVDIAAPGTGIVSTTPTVGNMAMTVFGVSTNYDTLSTTANGTSQATGYISGAAALVWSHYPALPKEVIKGLLLKTVDPVLTTPMLNKSGGRVNVHSALTLIPPGKPGKVINARNPQQLYDTIQAAIDEAEDGDELIAEANSLFFEGINFEGKAITLRSGDINEPADANISPENTVILGMLSDGSTVTFANNEGPNTILKGLTISRGDTDYGGGITCDGASPTITDCIISDNTAKYYGAGIDCTNGSSPVIKNCTITGNKTSGSTAIGGGINIEDSSPTIESCVISYNFADNVGGGIACYNSNPVIFNCLIANNSAVYKSGGIELENSSPVITNCTIIVDDPNAPKDGGIFAFQDSSPVITNCILWGNGDDLFNCSATYSCIEDDDLGIGNIHVKPTFVTGPLGDYYLSQKAAGQLSDSSCVDVGDPDTDPGLQ
ncbi:MAG: S8 family serine peptidase, partial [Planctomycetota bacterium]